MLSGLTWDTNITLIGDFRHFSEFPIISFSFPFFFRPIKIMSVLLLWELGTKLRQFNLWQFEKLVKLTLHLL